MEPFAERNFDSKELEMYRDLRKRFQVRTLYERFRLAVTHAGKSYINYHYYQKFRFKTRGDII